MKNIIEIEEWLKEIKCTEIVVKNVEGRIILDNSMKREYRDQLCVQCTNFQECSFWNINNSGKYRGGMYSCKNRIVPVKHRIKKHDSTEGQL